MELETREKTSKGTSEGTDQDAQEVEPVRQEDRPEGKTEPVSPSYPSEKIRRASHMLFFKRGRIPGARAWELKASLGRSYEKVLEQLDEGLKDLDLQVKKVESAGVGEYSPDGEDEKLRYFVRLRGSLTPKEARMTGWRIDNLAALAASLALIVSKQGKVDRKELESLISEKAGRWRTLTLTDTFMRTGYLEEDENGMVSLGWRTKAEVDLPSLMMLLAETKSDKDAGLQDTPKDSKNDALD